MHQWAVRRELLTPEEMKARVQSVKLQDLHDLLEEFPLDTPGVLVGFGPLKDLKKPVAAAKPKAKEKSKKPVAKKKSSAKK